MHVRFIVLSALASASPAIAQHQHAAAACASPAPLPAGLAGWTAALPVAAAVRAGDVGRAMLPIGKGARATLAAATAVTYPVAPSRTRDGRGGLFGFTIKQAGRYRVALGASAWIDVVGDGRAATSVAHGHGPKCSAVRKMVDFDVTPGRYVLQVVGAERPTLDLMVARLP